MKASKRASLGFVSLSLLALAGCPVTADDLCAKGTCDATVDATSPPPGDAGPDGIVVAPRDPCVDTPTAAECVSDQSALFVSKAADPNGADGTLAHPYTSIATALAKVTSEKKRVYVCEGTYEEQISIETIPTTLIGGLACDFRTPGAKPKIAPKSGIALGIASVGGASVIDVAIEAVSDANAPGSSAVGVFITTSTDILLRGVEIEAGDGQPGKDGDDASPTANHPGTIAAFPANGNANGTGGTGPTCAVCADGTKSIAGSGASTSGTFATSGDAVPKVGTANGGGSGVTCGVGMPGASGSAGAKASGGTVPGKLAAKSWSDRTTTALAGKNGTPGQGGGGGGVITSPPSGGGGSGACGGCGGAGGGAGADGGSSIGVLVFRSTKVVFEKSSIATGTGGKGGKGGNGQKGQEAPQAGGQGGGGNACGGGGGGHGAGGGGGGGGAGGYSTAIAHVGDAPITNETALAPGTPGAPGNGGTGGDPGGSGGNRGNDGADGTESAAGPVLLLEP